MSDTQLKNVVENLSKITTIPPKCITSLFNKEAYCIVDFIHEDTLSNVTLTEIDIGIGTLSIYHDNSDLKYRFSPNKAFNESVIKAAKGELNLMESAMEKTLVDKIVNTYKDLL